MFIFSPVYRYFGCLKNSFTNNTAITILIKISLCPWVFLQNGYPEVKLFSQRPCYLIFLVNEANSTKLFLFVANSISLGAAGPTHFFTAPPVLDVIILFNLYNIGGISLCSFNSHSFCYYWGWVSYHVFISYFYLPIFKNWVFILLLSYHSRILIYSG